MHHLEDDRLTLRDSPDHAILSNRNLFCSRRPVKGSPYFSSFGPSRPDLILSNNTPTTAALLRETGTIPIIFAIVADPLSSGFVESFSRPGGNATGFVTFEGSLGGKCPELLKEIAPRITRVAFLFNPATATYIDYYVNPFKAAAPSLGLESIAAPVRDGSELVSVIAAQAREPNSGLIVMPDTFLNTLSQRDHIAGRSLSSPRRLSIPFLR